MLIVFRYGAVEDFVLKDVPERMKDMLALWKQFEAEKYDIYLSQVTLAYLSLVSNFEK